MKDSYELEEVSFFNTDIEGFTSKGHAHLNYVTNSFHETNHVIS